MDAKISRLLMHARQHSEFYRNIMSRVTDYEGFYDKFKLTKRTIHENQKIILVDKYRYNTNDLLSVSTTSGTSGNPTLIYWSDEDRFRSNVSIWRLRKRYYKIDPCDYYCSLYNYNYSDNHVNKADRVVVNGNNIMLCKMFHDSNSLRLYYDVMCKYSPTWLMIQPSFANQFVDFLKNNHLPAIPSIKLIEFTGEFLTNTTRYNVANFFQCNTANMYGSMETNVIAYECPCGSMHILDDNVALNTDMKKKVYITSLHNYAFPLINYEIGDMLELKKNYRCSCGMQSDIIERIIGRTSKQIAFNNGSYINEGTIVYCVDRAESVIRIGVKNYKAKFNNDTLTIIIECEHPNEPVVTKFIEEVNKNIHDLCGDINVQYEISDSLVRFPGIYDGRKYAILED